MRVIEQFYFFNNTGSTGECANAFHIPQDSDNLIVEVYGSATSVAITVSGIVDAPTNTSDWTTLGAINMTDFSVATSINGKGTYAIPVSGMTRIKMSITSISGGSVTVLGKAGN